MLLSLVLEELVGWRYVSVLALGFFFLFFLGIASRKEQEYQVRAIHSKGDASVTVTLSNTFAAVVEKALRSLPKQVREKQTPLA